MGFFRSATQHLLSERRLRGHGLGTPQSALLANFLPLLNALQGFIDAHGQEFDDGILHAHTAFEFANSLRIRREGQQYVITFPLLLHSVGKTALAPLFNLIDSATGGGDVFRHLFDEAGRSLLLLHRV